MRPPDDEIETAMLRGAVIALRRRGDRQRKRAADLTIVSPNGVRIVAGEGRIAERIAAALEATATEIERAPL
jgi:hypothetical protein